MADVEKENDTLTHNLEERQEYIQVLERVNQLPRQQTAGNFAQPDYEVTRDRALAKLKMGKQSTAGKAIEAFIKELKHGL